MFSIFELASCLLNVKERMHGQDCILAQYSNGNSCWSSKYVSKRITQIVISQHINTNVFDFVKVFLLLKNSLR